MALFQNNYGAAQTDAYGNVPSTDEYGNAIRTDKYDNAIRTDEYGNVIGTDEYGKSIRTDESGYVIPTDDYGNPIRHSGTTFQGMQRHRHDHSTEYDGQGRSRRNKAGEAGHSTDAYGNVIRTDTYGNVIPTDDYGNPIRHSGSTLHGVQQHLRHDLSTEYDGQGGRRNKAGEAAQSTDAYGNPIRTDEYGNVRADEYGNPIRMSGVGHRDHRSDASYATATTYPTTAGYGTGEQVQHRHHRGVMEKIKDKLSGTSYDQHNEYY